MLEASNIKVTPWATFDNIWTSIMGYPADEFKFVPGSTPMSTLSATLIVIISYYAIIFGGREWMRNRPAYKLNTLFMAHNLMLTVVSGSLLVLFAGQLVPQIWKFGVYENICGASGWTDPLVTLYYVS